MKVLVFLLLLANLLLYAFVEGYFGRPENPDAWRLEQQLAADRLRIVGRSKTPPAKGATEQPAEPEELCLLWDRLAGAQANELASTLAEKFPGVRVERRAVAVEGAGWWVLVPPQASKAEADKKVGELKELGVDDLFVVHDTGAYRFAISLGVFTNENGGQERLAELKAKGVKSAKLIPRTGKEPQFTVEVRGPLAKRTEVLEHATGIMPKSAALNCK